MGNISVVSIVRLCTLLHMYGNTYLTLDKLVQLACYCYVHGYIHMYGTMYGSTYLALISKWYISSM